ncbi:MAG: hypothetical protein KBE09_01585 [Candidatus Pacebacteria bacterium]|nr:hypothetical protein [Candidatus Paceibacterota bacterium]
MFASYFIIPKTQNNRLISGCFVLSYTTRALPCSTVLAHQEQDVAPTMEDACRQAGVRARKSLRVGNLSVSNTFLHGETSSFPDPFLHLSLAYRVQNDRLISGRFVSCRTHGGGRVRAPNENLIVSAAALHPADDTYKL